MIAAGRVYLNDKIAEVGNRYKSGDQVFVDGIRMKAQQKEKSIVMAFNKPEGITTTTDSNIRGNMIDFINYPKRIFPIGRLDKDSEGLIFLTNDGDIVNKILRAGNSHEKEYAVQVDKSIDTTFLRKMAGGVVLSEEKTLPCKIKQTGRQSFNIILIQGLNRQIRRMCEALGYKVVRLKRIRIMHINLGDLRTGKWRLLSEPEMKTLKIAIEGSNGTAETKRLTTENSSRKIKKEGGQGVSIQSPGHAKFVSTGNVKKGSNAANQGKKSPQKAESLKGVSRKKFEDAQKKSSKLGSFKSYRIRGRKS